MLDTLFTAAEKSRYNRHLIMPDFGIKAQEKLKKSSVLVVGAGGLGSPMLLYLAAAGIGKIGILDCDVVEDSNLQRQILFGIDGIGKSKAAEAKHKLELLNPYIEITVHNTQLTAANALEILEKYDVVADGTDNFPTRYLVNDACVLLGKPNVYASIYQFEGQVSVFNDLMPDGSRGPNYRDIFPFPPEPGSVPNCSEAGVLGVLPGIIGSMQALEVIKVVANIGDRLSGRLFAFNALSFESMTYNIKKNFDNAEIVNNGLINYEQFCGVPAIEKKIKEVSPSQLATWLEQGHPLQIIDVRETYEYDIVNIEGELIPLATLEQQYTQIATDKKVIIHCKMGGRSASAIKLMEDKFGMTNLYNLKGGIINYIQELELDLPTY